MFRLGDEVGRDETCIAAFTHNRDFSRAGKEVDSAVKALAALPLLRISCRGNNLINLGMDLVPYASAAMACAPPMR